MKKLTKILVFALVLVMIFSLSSCLFLEDGFFLDDGESGAGTGDNIFNVQGGDNNEINITVNGQKATIGQKIDTSHDKVAYKGKPLAGSQKKQTEGHHQR